MTHRYIGTKQVTAWPQEREGRPGYAVQYPDGYTSWSPADVFEAAYRVTEGDGQRLTFGDALVFLREGRKVARAGWNGKGMWIEMQRPDAHSKMTQPYLYIEYPAGHPAYPNGCRVPWLASQTDLLAEDWAVVS